jgi:5'-nucleotidase
MSDKSKLILVTNDDGYLAPGIRTLVKALAPLGRIVVVAPDSERSATGHSLTLYHPLRLELREEQEGIQVYSCNGMPTDCVSLSLYFLLREKPDLLVSGINAGGNLGDDITYSGTVMAAMEGATQGVPSMAVSLVTEKIHDDYEPAAEFAAQFAENLLGFPQPEEVFFSINVPAVPGNELRGAMVTAQGRSVYHQKIVEREDPRGKKYYWVKGLRAMGRVDPGSDFYAIEHKMISVTPLQISMTHEGYISELEKWELFKSQQQVNM